MTMSHPSANPTAPDLQPRPPHSRHDSTPHNPNPTSHNTTQASQSAKQHDGADQGPPLSQSLTERNLGGHNRQQNQHLSIKGNDGMPPEEYFAKLHQDHTARILAAGQSLGIDQSEIQMERSMQNSQAATSMEWYLAEDKRRRHNWGT